MKVKNEVVSTNKQSWTVNQQIFRSPDSSPTRPIVVVSPTKRVNNQEVKVTSLATPTFQNATRISYSEKPAFAENRMTFLETTARSEIFSGSSNLKRKIAQVEPFNILDDQPLDLSVKNNQNPVCRSKFQKNI